MPHIRFTNVSHIGSLKRPPEPRHSLEGHCLSVSRCPEAWGHIARIGGDLWRLRKTGAKFLDALSVGKPLLSDITDWGVIEGLVTRQTTWNVETWDEEIEETRYSAHFTQEEAEEEAGRETQDETDEDSSIVEVPNTVVMTEKLRILCNQERRSIICTQDFLLIAFAEAQDLDGVWWTEDLDVPGLSAPRGGILPGKLPTWSIKKVRAI